ncbi:MAG: phosphotransferase [Coprobacillus sp.]|nr:phosphotransferase [Coprobacillus sp.]
MDLDKDLLDDIFSGDYTVIFQLEGGMTNKSYLVEARDSNYIYYVPTEFASETINRSNEMKASMAAFKAGLTSMSIYFDPKTGVKINSYIYGNSLNKIEDYDVEKVAELLHNLHNLDVKGMTTLDLKDNMGFYLNYIKDKSALDPRFNAIWEYFLSFSDYLKQFPHTLCHHDFQRSNVILSDSGRYYVIDFEFASYGDPVYDISAFSNDRMEDGLELLKAYFKDEINIDSYKRFYLYRIYLSLQWYIVATIKADDKENDALGIDFKGVASYFLDNAEECAKTLKEKF